MQEINFKDIKANEMLNIITKELDEQIKNPVQFKDTLIKLYNLGTLGLGRYSLTNRYLIQLQCPNASDTRTFNAWKNAGVKVRKGEKAIMITAPVPVVHCKNKEHQKDMHLCDENCPDRMVGIRFKKVPVFDVSQTDQYDKNIDKVIKANSSLNDEKKYQQITEYLKEQKPFKYDEEILSNGLMGYTHKTPFGDEIVVAKNEQLSDKFGTLFHEFGHHSLGHLYDDRGYVGQARGIKEIQAEMYSVMSSLSLGTENEAQLKNQIAYISDWAKATDEKSPIKEFETVDKQFRKDFENIGEVLDKVSSTNKAETAPKAVVSQPDFEPEE